LGHGGQFTGAHLNPAVTVGLWTAGVIDGGDVPKYLIGEFLGAFIGAALVLASYWDHFKETEDPGLKLAVFSTGPAIRNYPLNVVTEIIGTFVLVYGVLSMLVANKAGAFMIAGGQPLIVGLLVLAIGLSLGGPTGYAINPARDLGPRIAHAILPVPGKGPSDWAYSWVPVIGPLIGGVLAGAAYHWWFGL
jgi:glycerol uptake facilitator protein